jgi:hypothetical protein
MKAMHMKSLGIFLVALLAVAASPFVHADDTRKSLKQLEKFLTCQQYGETREILPLIELLGGRAQGESPFGDIYVFSTAPKAPSPKASGHKVVYVIVDDDGDAPLLYAYLATGSERSLAKKFGAKKNKAGEYEKLMENRQLLIVKDTEKYPEKPAQTAIILACDMDVNIHLPAADE